MGAESRSPAGGHAFLSYVREDSAQVDRLQQVLQDAGIPVWRDKSDLWPGEDWRERIREAITDDALVFIACFSANSRARERTYQNEELVLAIEQLRLRRLEKPWLIPVRLDDCEPPDRDIGGGRRLSSLQRVDVFGDGFDQGASRLVAAILRILGPSGGKRVVAAPHNSDESLPADRHEARRGRDEPMPPTGEPIQGRSSVPGTGLRDTSTSGGQAEAARRWSGTAKAAPSPQAPRPTAAPVPAPKARREASQTAAPTSQARESRSAPLRGQRSSVLPWRSPALTGPLVIRGYLARITLHPDRVQIDRGFMGRINGNRSAIIPWSQLVGIDFLEPTRRINGHIHFVVSSDPRGLTATGNGDRLVAAARNPHAVMFTWQQRGRYEELRAVLASAATPD